MSQEEKPLEEQMEELRKAQEEAPGTLKALNEQVRQMAQEVESVKLKLVHSEEKVSLAMQTAKDKAWALEDAERELRRIKERNEYLEALGKKPETCQAQCHIVQTLRREKEQDALSLNEYLDQQEELREEIIRKDDIIARNRGSYENQIQGLEEKVAEWTQVAHGRAREVVNLKEENITLQEREKQLEMANADLSAFVEGKGQLKKEGPDETI